MRKNKIKEMMKDGKPVINGWLSIPSTVSTEAMAHQGWDSLTIDVQHGLVDYTNVLPMLQTISSTNVTPLTRVNWTEPGQIMKLLDAGSYGVICPMVSNKEQAENFEVLEEAYTGSGTLINSEFLNGLDIEKAKVKIIEEVEKKKEELFEKRDRILRCLACEYECTADKAQMKRHIETHFEGLSYTCTYCNKEFRSVNALYKHNQTEYHKTVVGQKTL